jgi:hypothetical protein
MIAVPESVLAYYSRNDVNAAVTLLLGLKKNKIPPLPGWDDVPAYYRAWLAAQQTKADFATFLESVWNAVWTEVPTGWQAPRPDQPKRLDLSVAIDFIWEEGCFSRRFERGGLAMELSIWLNDVLRLGFVLYDRADNVLLDEVAMPGWHQVDDYDTFWTDECAIISDVVIDTSVFQPMMRQVRSALKAAAKPR